MQNGLGKAIQLVRYYSSVTLLYGATLLFAFYIFNPSIFDKTVRSHPALENTPTHPLAAEPERAIKMGKPVRLIIERLGLNFPIDEGYYNQADGSWTLEDKRVYFAMPSALANDYSGNTMLYGHNTVSVFVPLKHLIAGDVAQVHTDNGLIFRYAFTMFEEVQPENTSIFDYEGAPRLTLQTCTGNWYEKRGFYYFSLVPEESAV